MPLSLPTSRQQIEKLQSERKRIAVERARRAPFFAGQLDHINLDRLDDWDEWSKIPILEKESLRNLTPDEFSAQFCIAPRDQIAELWRSGGSTGVPLFYPRTFEDMEYAKLSFARVFGCTGAPRGNAPAPARRRTAQCSAKGSDRRAPETETTTCSP